MCTSQYNAQQLHGWNVQVCTCLWLLAVIEKLLLIFHISNMKRQCLLSWCGFSLTKEHSRAKIAAGPVFSSGSIRRLHLRLLKQSVFFCFRWNLRPNSDANSQPSLSASSGRCCKHTHTHALLQQLRSVVSHSFMWPCCHLVSRGKFNCLNKVGIKLKILLKFKQHTL